MNGFKDISFNQAIASNILKDIIIKVITCCDLMVQDCTREHKKINNNEVDIRDYLFFNYLDNDEIAKLVGFNEFRFFSEAPDNYINNKPVGRVDLKVISSNMFRHRKRYFIIECKRIDGTAKLNRHYIKDGIKRFVATSPSYYSFYNSNCMFGFVVKDIDINKNTMKINQLQKEYYLDIKIKSDVEKITLKKGYSDTYVSTYAIGDVSDFTLFHAFYNLSSIIVA